jgi:DNA-binding NarL/FixJ family response regulator
VTTIELTPREAVIADYISLDWTDKEIATFLGIGVSTVREHVGNLIIKMKCLGNGRSRTGRVSIALAVLRSHLRPNELRIVVSSIMGGTGTGEGALP